MVQKVHFKKILKYHVEFLGLSKIRNVNEIKNKAVKTNIIVGAGELSK